MGRGLAEMTSNGRSLTIAMVAACPFPLARGTPIRIERMADALAQRGHAVDIFTYHFGSERPGGGYQVIRIAGVPGYRRERPGPSLTKLAVLDPQLALKLFQGARTKRYDVIHAHHVEGLLAAQPAARLRGIPTVYDVHTLLQSELPYYGKVMPNRLISRIGRRIDRFLPRLADHVITVSEALQSEILDGGTHLPQSVSLIPNGVEKEMFAARPVSAAKTPSMRLAYAGNLAEYQGFDLLLHAFSVARAKRQDLRLHVMTEDRLNGYEQLARKLGVHDAIDLSSVALKDLPTELAACDVAINPRIDCAGLPQKLLNYMAAGCPIVSFAGSAKHITHESSALIVEDRNVGAMAAAMLRLIDDRSLANRLGQQAQDYARAELSWQRVAERVETAYHHILRDKPA